MAKCPAAYEKLCSYSIIPPVDGFFYETKKTAKAAFFIFHTRDEVGVTFLVLKLGPFFLEFNPIAQYGN